MELKHFLGALLRLNGLVLIVPFMELKHKRFILLIWITYKVLIVPFMELKQEGQSFYLSRFCVLIVPFMELKRLLAVR